LIDFLTLIVTTVWHL